MRLRRLFPGSFGLSFVIVTSCGSSGGSSPPPPSDSGADARGDAAAADAAPSGGDAGGGIQPGQPITTPADQWTFVPFSNAFCADGTSTGIGVNLHAGATRVLVYLEGGGACWSDLTCYTLMTASNFTTGYGASQFATESTDTTYLAEPGGFFDRTSAANPFADYSYVYVPYCTGDMHAGNNIFHYPSGTAHHVGYTNFSAYLSRLIATFTSVDRVVLAGSSAGGYGALYNWAQTQQAFGATRVDLIDDSGTFMPPDIAADGMGESTWRAQWNLPATLPPGCAGCATSLTALYPFYASAFPQSRGALLSYTQDSVIPGLYGITTAQFTSGLDEVLTSDFVPTQNLRSFQVNQMGHTLWFQPTVMASNGELLQFVTKMVTDDPTWQNLGP